MTARRVATIAAVLLVGSCSPTQRAVEPAKPDPAQQPEYLAAVEQLAMLNREAEGLFQKSKREEAGALITKAQPLSAQVLSVPRPTLAGMEAASDHDDLYGRLLLTNKHYGWARLFFQKNLARWTNWKPQTQDTERRRKLAEDRIAECDRQLTKN